MYYQRAQTKYLERKLKESLWEVTKGPLKGSFKARAIQSIGYERLKRIMKQKGSVGVGWGNRLEEENWKGKIALKTF